MTKQQKIDLLMQFVRGEIPASKLKRYNMIFFMYTKKEQQAEIEAITGPVIRFRSKYLPGGEPVIGLFEGIPVGFTAWWHLSMIMHPDCTVTLISGNNIEGFNQFIIKLRKEYEQ
jgi:hypothetical protein